MLVINSYSSELQTVGDYLTKTIINSLLINSCPFCLGKSTKHAKFNTFMPSKSGPTRILLQFMTPTAK